VWDEQANEPEVGSMIFRAGRIGKLGFRASLVAVIAVATLALPAVATAASTTLDFEGLAPGTQVSNQFDGLGIDFVNGVIGGSFNDLVYGDGVACYPVVTAVGAAAHSGTQVGDIGCADGEFPDSSVWANLADTASQVSLYAGFAPNYSDAPTSAQVTLAGYDITGAVVDHQTATIEAGSGTQTLLSVSSPGAANIVAFGVFSNDKGVQIDDVNFQTPSGLTPDFGISAQNGSVQPVQGGSANDTINIRRVNGSTGAVALSASGLPAGVHASFSPNPATGNSATMTIATDPSAVAATSGTIPSFTITGTPNSSTVGPASRTASEVVDVIPFFTLNEPSVKVPPCSTLQVPITLGAGAGFSGTVGLSASGGPSDDQASFSPATLNYPSQTKTLLTITSQSDASGPAGTISVTAAGSNGISDTWHVPVTRVAPSITSLTDSSNQQLSGGLTPQGASSGEGTIVIIHGQGFCPGSTVQFGNAQASAVTQGPFTDGLGPDGDETAIRAYVPSLATTGNVYVVPAGANLSSPATASAPFTVDSYRNTDGFAFDNSDQFQNNVGGYSWSDVVDVFGYENTHISVNPCWPFGDCSIVTPVPDPLAAIFWGVVNDLGGSGGQCFGFSLASQRLLHGDQTFSAFPLQPGVSQDSVWNLNGPDPGSGASGASGSVAHFIHLMHMEQFSRQSLAFWLEKATGNAINGSQTSLMNDVTSALNSGDHPLVEIRDGTQGHAMVAYAVDQADGNTSVGPGDRVIDVYNPDAPFTTGENATGGTAHQEALATSQIIVHPNGHWEFKGFSPEYSGGPGSLVIMPYSTVPVQPSLPINISDIVSLVFGSATATQISDGNGHQLLSANGNIDNSAKTGIPDATQFATQSGTNTPGPGIFLFGHPGNYTTTVHGNATGQYHQVLFSRGNSASITAAATRSVSDTISTTADLGGLQFGQSNGSSDHRHATVQLVRHSGAAELTATVAVTVPGTGRGDVAFTGGDAGVEVSAGQQSTSAALTLSWTGPDGLPQTFAAPAVKLDAGDTASFTPSHWSSLQAGTVAVRLRHANGKTTRLTLHNRLRPANRYSVALAVTRRGKRRALQVSVHATKVVANSSGLVTWEVLQGRRLVARHVISVRNVHRGVSRLTFLFKPGSADYTFNAKVALLSPGKAGGYDAQQVVRSRTFKG
jgi:hypothetical protein